GRSSRKSRDTFLSRPRFLAISEFGPRAFLYHEGSRYIINRVILPVGDAGDQAGEGRVLTTRAKQCDACGYFHPLGDAEGADVCERSEAPLPEPFTRLFRLQNVVTKRREKITSDEEERQRLGYEIRTGVRFGEPGGRPSWRTAAAKAGETAFAGLSYGQAAS